MPEVHDEEGQRESRIEGPGGICLSNREVAQQGHNACDEDKHRAIEDTIPHETPRLVGVDVDVEELVFVHEVHETEVDGGEGADEGRDLQRN